MTARFLEAEAGKPRQVLSENVSQMSKIAEELPELDNLTSIRVLSNGGGLPNHHSNHKSITAARSIAANLLSNATSASRGLNRGSRANPLV